MPPPALFALVGAHTLFAQRQEPFGLPTCPGLGMSPLADAATFGPGQIPAGPFTGIALASRTGVERHRDTITTTFAGTRYR